MNMPQTQTSMVEIIPSECQKKTGSKVTLRDLVRSEFREKLNWQKYTRNSKWRK